MGRLKVLYVSNEAGVGGAMQSMLDMIVGMTEYVSPVVIIPSAGMAEGLLKERKIVLINTTSLDTFSFCSSGSSLYSIISFANTVRTNLFLSFSKLL